MSSRVRKKLVPELESLDGAVLLVNALDPQLETIKIFQEAVENLPHFIIVNKCDLATLDHIQRTVDKLNREDTVLSSLKDGRGLSGIKQGIKRLPCGKIAILGIFNSGKTSLINTLTGEDSPIGDIPGTTLEFTNHPYEDWILVDTVGQIIDVNMPLMVSVDLTGQDTVRGKLLEVLSQDMIAIEKSVETAIEGLEEAVDLIINKVERGGKVITVGAGASSLVAMEMAGQGQETGLPTMVFTNNFSTNQPLSFAKGAFEDELSMAEYVSRAVNQNDVVIGVSASGGTAFVHETLWLAKEKGASTIAITENADTPLGHYADIIIKSEAKPEGPSSSKIQAAHLAIGHALILTIADIRGISAGKSIEYMLPKTVANKKMGIK